MTEIISMCIGALIVLISVRLMQSKQDKRERNLREIDEKMREIDTLILLNKKVNEILVKRNYLLGKYTSFDDFDDCFITVDDYIYLQSYCAQNHFFLPSYIVEEFFQNIAHRQVILAPEEVERLGGYAYKGGRILIETFSDELMRCAEDRKIELKQLRGF